MSKYNEIYRPQFHFTAPDSWINDPNGLVYYDGEYHLFYQNHPGHKVAAWEVKNGKPWWGHAVSSDLIHWKHLPLTSIQAGSGSCVIDSENCSGLKCGKHSPMLAFHKGIFSYSNDKGLTWTEYENGIILPKHADPWVFWHAPSKHWIMVTFISPEDNRNFLFYRSKDLKNWTLSSNWKGFFRECPGLFEVKIENTNETRWIFHSGNGEYFIGDFDGQSFIAQKGKYRMDWGQFYASQLWNNIPSEMNRKIQIAWMYGTNFPTEAPCNQQLTFPCDLTLRQLPEGLRLCRMPIPEIKYLYESTIKWENETISPSKNLLADIKGDCFDIELEAIISEPEEFQINVNGMIVRYIAAQKMIYVNTDIHHSPGITAPLDLYNASLKLRVLVDRCSVEVFAGEGQIALTQNYFPTEDKKGLSIESERNEIKLISMQLRKLRSAWS